MGYHSQTDEVAYQKSLARAVARGKGARATDLQNSSAEIYLVPQHKRWPAACRAAPNIFFRSALFQAKNKKDKRIFLTNEKLPSIGPMYITFTGQELRQDDLVLWLHIIQLAYKQPVGKTITFVPSSLCKAINWNVGGKSYVRIRECLTRMVNTSLTVYNESQGKEYSFPLISYFNWLDTENEKSIKKYQIQIARELIEFYADEHFTQLSWQEHLKLPVGVATWLHGYLASHKKPFAIKIDSIRKGSGMTTHSKSSALQIISAALKTLEDVGFLNHWHIHKGLVHAVRALKS